MSASPEEDVLLKCLPQALQPPLPASRPPDVRDSAALQLPEKSQRH